MPQGPHSNSQTIFDSSPEALAWWQEDAAEADLAEWLEWTHGAPSEIYDP